jgi:cytochrome c oxidase subunit 1
MWGGRIRLRVPMLFAIAFLFQFLISGLTGILLAVAPFDWQLTDTYFVVAHFHYVLVGAIVFMIFAAIYYWFPKATGKMLDERLGQWHFWLFVIGFHLTFDTLHFAGFAGMARRIYTYQPGRGLETYNLLASIGVIFQAFGVCAFLLSVVKALISGKPAGEDPWDAWTLEWSTASPPPEYNFADVPTVHSRRPLWDLKHPDDPDWLYE